MPPTITRTRAHSCSARPRRRSVCGGGGRTHADVSTQTERAPDKPDRLIRMFAVPLPIGGGGGGDSARTRARSVRPPQPAYATRLCAHRATWWQRFADANSLKLAYRHLTPILLCALAVRLFFLIHQTHQSPFDLYRLQLRSQRVTIFVKPNITHAPHTDTHSPIN